MPITKHLVHIFPSFEMGGAQIRTTTLINSLKGLRHSILALNGKMDAKRLLNGYAEVDVLSPPEKRRMSSRLKILHQMLSRAQPDLVISYNWGAIDAVLVNLLKAIAPVVHIEDGFGVDEAVSLKWRRINTRRLLLRRIFGTVVPSRTLERIALQQYRLPPAKVVYIPNGVNVDRFRPGVDPETRARLASPDEAIYGFVGQFRNEKNLAMMIRSFAAAKLPKAKLVLVGDGPCRNEIDRAIRETNCGNRVVLTGQTDNALPFLQSFDVFVLSSKTEQMPMSVLEAMACGVPVLSTSVGDCAEMLGYAGPPWITPSNDETSLTTSFRAIHGIRHLWAGVGQQNRGRCLKHYSSQRMVDAHDSLYAAAMRGLHE